GRAHRGAARWRRWSCSWSASLLARLAYFGGKSFEVGWRERAVGHLKQCNDGALGGTVEEGLEQVVERRASSPVSRDGGQVHVPWAVLFVSHVPLLLEHVHRGAHGRVAWWIGELSHDVSDGGFAVAVKDVHDLGFAPSELGAWRGGGGAGVGHRSLVLGKQQCAAYLASEYGWCQWLVSVSYPATRTSGRAERCS